MRTRTHPSQLFAGFVATLACACSAASGAASTPLTASTLSDADLDAYAEASCAGLTTCCASNGLAPSPLADCLALARKRAMSFRAEAVAVGRVVGDEAAVERCVAEVRHLTTSCSVEPIYWHGTDPLSEENDPCYYAFGPDPKGESCNGGLDTHTCGPGLACIPDGPPPAVPCCHGGLGGPHTSCLAPPPPLVVGAVCDPTLLQCEHDAYCDASAAPMGSGLCARLRGVGETCTTGDGTTPRGCVAEAYCDQATSLCEPKRPAGALVTSGVGEQPQLCASGASFDGKCLANPYRAGIACQQP